MPEGACGRPYNGEEVVVAAGSSTQLRCDGNVGVAASCAEGACPASPCSEDRRITRSKKALRSALITLIEEKGFEAITVNDLCSAADLNRGTFYNHFRSKEHLLATFEDEVRSKRKWKHSMCVT